MNRLMMLAMGVGLCLAGVGAEELLAADADAAVRAVAPARQPTAATTPPSPRGQATTAVLHLKNGDRLDGQLDVSSTAGEVRWRSPIFQDPVVFDSDGVSYVSYLPPREEESPPSPAPPVQNVPNPLAAGFLQLLRQFPSSRNGSSTAIETLKLPVGMRVELAADQVLFGTLVALDDQYLTIRSERHGSVRIRRSQVRTLDGVATNASLMFDGTGHRAGWQSLGKGRTTAEWQADGRSLTTTTLGANLFFAPDQAVPTLFELELTGSKKPEFQVVLGASGRLADLGQGISLEVWGDELVVFSEASQPLEPVKLGPVSRHGAGWSLWVQAYYDPHKRQVEVYSGGKQLASYQVTGNPVERNSGWLIRNRGEELTVKVARLRRWAGPIRIGHADEKADLIVLTDGSWLEGQLQTVDVPGKQLTIRVAGEDRSVALEQVDRVSFHESSAGSPSPTVEAEPAVPQGAVPQDAAAATSAESAPAVLVTYLDGSLLRGDYAGVEAAGVRLLSDFSPDPLLIGWDNLAEVRFTGAATPPAEAHKTGFVQQRRGTLHGRIINDAVLAEMKWEPVYCRQPVRFATGRASRVSFEPTVHDVGVKRLFSELALTNGDTIPCDVIAIDEQQVTAKFATGAPVAFPRQYFKALRDYRPENWLYAGPAAGDTWLVSTADASLYHWQAGAFHFYGDVLLTREFDLPDRFRISFDVQWHQDADFVFGVGADTAVNAVDHPQHRAMTEEILKEAAKQKPDDLIEVGLMRRGRTLTVQGLSRVAGPLSMVMQRGGMAYQQSQAGSVALEENSVAHIDLLVDRLSREYVVLANGREAFRWKDPVALAGNFVHFGLGSPMIPSNLHRSVTRPAAPPVAIFNYRIARWPGAMPEDELDRFLTRRVGASKKTLTNAVRAANGDCLRGRLVSLHDDRIVFQSRLETMTFPRQSIVEIINLVPDASRADAPAVVGDEPRPADAAPTVPRDIDPTAAEGVAEAEAEAETVAAAEAGNAAENAGSPAELTTAPSAADTSADVRIRLWGGGQVTLSAVRASEELIQGESQLVGAVSLPWGAIAAIEFGSSRKADSPFARWVLKDPPPLPEAESSTAAAATASPWLDKPAPEIKLWVLDGEEVELATLKGRPVVLDFWASWCGPCLASMPTMMELADEFAGRVEFFAVNQQEDPDEVRDFLRARLWKLRVALDEDGALARTFGVEAIPYLVIVDAAGVVRKVHVGASPNMKAELTELLNDLLKS